MNKLIKPQTEQGLGSLKIRLAASFFAIALLILIPSLVWFYSAAEKLTEQRIENLLGSVLVHDSSLLAHSIENRDFWQLYRLARAMASPAHIDKVAVIDQEGKLLAHSDSDYYYKKAFDLTQQQQYISVPLEGLTGTVGYVLIARDKQGLASYFLPLKQGMLAISLVLLVLAGLLGILLTYVWHRHLEKEQSLAFLGELATELAHEIRNDLAPVKLLCELGEFTAADTQVMHTSLTHADELLETFMAFAKSGQRQDKAGHLIDCLNQIEQLAVPLITEKQINFSIQLIPEVATTQVAQKTFNLVVLNLVRNALQAVNTGGQVKLQLASSIKQLENPQQLIHLSDLAQAKNSTIPLANQQHIIIQLTDNGSGISPELQKKIFEPFITYKKGGTGLGLVLVRRYLQEINGQLSLTSSEKGSCFTLHWPLVKN